MNNIKKMLMLFLISLLIPITSSSQNISQDTLIRITPTQLKQTNLIFLEHKKLKEDLEIKDSIINKYEINIKNDSILDSLRKKEIKFYTDELNNKDSTIDELNKTLKKSKRKNKMLKYVSIGSLILGVLGISSIFIK